MKNGFSREPGTPADSANIALLPARLAGVAASMPDAVALSDGETTVSYRELNDYAGTIERHLRGHDIGCGQRVAVYLSRSLHLPIVILGILRTGATYVPIDRDQPRLRAEEIINDARVACLITDADASLASDVLTLTTDALLDSSRQHLHDTSRRAVGQF